MKLLFLGLVPVIIFWLVEDKWGTLWGLVAAMAWALGECIYEYVKNKRIDKLTLLSTGLVVGMGGIGILLDQSVIFKFQPVIMELIFAGILYWGGRGGEPFLLKMARQSKPEVFQNQNPEIYERQKNYMARMTRSLMGLLVLHCVVLSYVALKGTTGQWAFWKGIGFNVFLGMWLLIEFIILKRKSSKRT